MTFSSARQPSLDLHTARCRGVVRRCKTWVVRGAGDEMRGPEGLNMLRHVENCRSAPGCPGAARGVGEAVIKRYGVSLRSMRWMRPSLARCPSSSLLRLNRNPGRLRDHAIPFEPRASNASRYPMFGDRRCWGANTAAASGGQAFPHPRVAAARRSAAGAGGRPAGPLDCLTYLVCYLFNYGLLETDPRDSSTKLGLEPLGYRHRPIERPI